VLLWYDPLLRPASRCNRWKELAVPCVSLPFSEGSEGRLSADDAWPTLQAVSWAEVADVRASLVLLLGEFVFRNWETG
jgi:hypothetical protein